MYWLVVALVTSLLCSCTTDTAPDSAVTIATAVATPSIAELRSIEFSGDLASGERRRYIANLHCGAEWLAQFNSVGWRTTVTHGLDGDVAPSDWLQPDPLAVSEVELIVELRHPTMLLAWRPGSDTVARYAPAPGLVPCD